MLKNAVLLAVLVLLIAVPAGAQEARFSTPHLGWTASFIIGANPDSEHNSRGLMLGAQTALFRWRALRLPTLGVEAGFLDKCPLTQSEGPAGPDGECQMTGAIQLTTGLDIVFNTYRNFHGKPEGELAFTAGLGRVVAGPLRNHWSVRFGVAVRY